MTAVRRRSSNVDDQRRQAWRTSVAQPPRGDEAARRDDAKLRAHGNHAANAAANQTATSLPAMALDQTCVSRTALGQCAMIAWRWCFMVQMFQSRRRARDPPFVAAG